MANMATRLVLCSLLLVVVVGANKPVELTNDNFSETTEHGSWFIYFTAPWCNTCKNINSMFNDDGGNLQIGVIDIEAQPELADRFYVTKVPVAMFYEGGQMAQEEKELPTDVVVLTDDDFDATTKEGHWLVEFYAPWCGHCQQLAPTWESIATEMLGEVHVAKVDAPENPVLSEKFEVPAYPSIRYYHNGKITQYSGDRSKHDIMQFARDNVKSPIKDLDSKAIVTFKKLHEKNAAFVLLHTSISEPEKEAYERLSRYFRGWAHFAMSSDPNSAEALSLSEGDLPLLVGYRDGFEDVWKKVDLTKEKEVGEWVELVRRHRMPEMLASNYDELARDGKLTVVAVFDQEDEAQNEPYYQMMKELSHKYKEEFTFCWLDGPYWSEYLDVQYDIQHQALPHFFVMDDLNDEYYENRAVRSRQQIISFLDSVSHGTIEAKTKGAHPRREPKKPLTEVLSEQLQSFRESVVGNIEVVLVLVAVLSFFLGKVSSGGKARGKSKKA